jgi:hypothetical protein
MQTIKIKNKVIRVDALAPVVVEAQMTLLFSQSYDDAYSALLFTF